MAEFYLGAAFDIHCGGRDLVFPHHENEIAQAKCAGDDFAQYWLHNGWVTMSGEKMSKSLGNVLSVPNVLKKVRPQELRYYLVVRTTVPISSTRTRRWTKVRSPTRARVVRPAHTQACGRRRTRYVDRRFRGGSRQRLVGADRVGRDSRKASEGNSALAAGDLDAARVAAGQVRAMLAILGVDPLDEHWTQSGGDTETAMEALDVLVRADLDRRQQARTEKNWAVADEVRDRLIKAGIEVTDTPDGPEWSLKAGQ